MSKADDRAKLEKLKGLRSRIIQEEYVDNWREVWFFPKHRGVSGWRGTQDIIFVGLNPSKGHFPSQHDEFLYKQLKRNGFDRAHLTDIVKIKATRKGRGKLFQSEVTMLKHMSYLLEEIEIIHPRLVVVMGGKCRELLQEWLSEDVHKVRHMPHYAPQARIKEQRKNFRKRMKEIREEYDSHA